MLASGGTGTHTGIVKDKDEYMTDATQSKLRTRQVAPQFPSGFRAYELEHLLILDFLSAFPGEEPFVFSSIALSKDVAEQLQKALNRFVDSQDAED